MPLWLAAVLLAVPARAADVDGAKRIGKDWAIEADPLIAAPGRPERFSRARRVVTEIFDAGWRDWDGDKKSYVADSVAAFLADGLNAADDAVGVQVLIQPDEHRLFINRFDKGGSVLEMTGVWTADPSGLSGNGNGLLTSLRRVQNRDDATTAFMKSLQYFGADAVLRYRSEIGVDTKTGLTSGANVTQTLTYELQRRDPSTWNWRPEVSKAPGQTQVYWSERNLIETLRGLGGPTLTPALGGSVPCASADVSKQYFDDPERDQGYEPICHAFAATALAEAALARAYGIKVPLSEDDLAKQLSPDGHNGAGTIWWDLRLILKSGLTTRRSMSRAGGLHMVDPSRDERVKRALDSLSAGAGVPASEAPAVAARSAPTADGLAAERAVIQRALYNAGIDKEVILYTPLTMGVSQKYDLIKILCAGEPAAVGMQLGGLEEWDTEDKIISGHAFVIVGFDQKNGKFVFHTRNSWFRKNPDVKEDQLWRIGDIDRLIVGKPNQWFSASKAELKAVAEP